MLQLLRIIIRNFAEKMNYNINHLHDCIILHPNYVEDFYNIINELYHSDDMYYLAEKACVSAYENINIHKK